MKKVMVRANRLARQTDDHISNNLKLPEKDTSQTYLESWINPSLFYKCGRDKGEDITIYK